MPNIIQSKIKYRKNKDWSSKSFIVELPKILDPNQASHVDKCILDEKNKLSILNPEKTIDIIDINMNYAPSGNLLITFLYAILN